MLSFLILDFHCQIQMLFCNKTMHSPNHLISLEYLQNAQALQNYHLEFQLIVISHHEHRDLESYVDKIYYLSSDSDTGVKANLIHDSNSLTS